MFSIFCKVEGIPGESTDARHKDWIEVLSFQHGIHLPVPSVPGGPGVPSGRSQHQEFVIVKHLDKASPKLYESVCTGKHFKTVTIEMLRAGNQFKFMEIDLDDVIISGVAPAGSAQATDPLPAESVNFFYERIRWIYTPMLPDGSPGPQVTGGWDIAANKPI